MKLIFFVFIILFQHLWLILIFSPDTSHHPCKHASAVFIDQGILLFNYECPAYSPFILFYLFIAICWSNITSILIWFLWQWYIYIRNFAFQLQVSSLFTIHTHAFVSICFLFISICWSNIDSIFLGFLRQCYIYIRDFKFPIHPSYSFHTFSSPFAVETSSISSLGLLWQWYIYICECSSFER